MNENNKITCIIDDDEIYLFSVRKAIQATRLSNKILEFRNGKDALEYFSHCKNTHELPDVIFIDINMPVMNGWQFIEAFKKMQPGISKEILLYVVSSSVNKSDVDRAMQVANDYLVKPISPSQLKQIYQSVF